MVSTPSKRTASASPESRPSKRRATSPEEGELDDATDTPQSPNTRLTPAPAPTTASTPTAKFEPKVKFPFKSKASTSSLPVPSLLNGKSDGEKGHEKNGVGGGGAPKVVYERSREDEEKFMELDAHKRSNGFDFPSRRRPAPFGDHYEPSYNPRSKSRRDPDRDSDRHWEPGRQKQRSRDKDRVRSPPRSRVGVERERSIDSYRPVYPDRRDWDDHDSHGSPPRNRDRDGDRSPSSLSPKRSHSPSEKGKKHRLPAPRTEAYVASPRRHDYDDHYEPNGGAHHIRDRDPYEHYRRDSPDHYDGYGVRHDAFHRRDDRGYNSYESHAPDRPYRLASPPAPRGPPSYNYSEHHTPELVSRSEELPTVSSPSEPVLPPPPDAHLPAEHARVSINLTRPGAPLDPHSPTPLHLPVEYDAGTKRKSPVTDEKVLVEERKRREPMHRTREQEKEAYGHVFVGCGQQADYEILTKLGEGTFGEVHKAIHKTNKTTVALKRILMHNEKEGMPVTALREIKILKALKHPCVIELLDMFVVRSKGKDSPLSVYMVFPYMDHDLAGLLENDRVKLLPSQIKLYMKQLLEGTEYMHRNHILHRDMKAANLLISNTGSLRIADFGLARAFDPDLVNASNKVDRYGKERKYTNCVVTRWYRPPELLLGAKQYGGEVDMWGVGCVLGEMFMRQPILMGTSDMDQLDKIWALCGSPNQHSWPHFDSLPGCEGRVRFSYLPRVIKQQYDRWGTETADLLDKLLICNPRERYTASQALDHDYFWSDPLPADPKSLPTYEASHEFDKRGRRHQVGPVPAGQPPHHPHDGRHGSQPPVMQMGPPIHFGRPPPTRESFRTGPPPSRMPHPMQGPPYPGPPYFPGQLPPHPGYYPPPQQYGQYPPQHPHHMHLPSHPHLPPRPSGPPPSHHRGGDGHRGYRSHAPRTDHRGGPQGGTGELNYG